MTDEQISRIKFRFISHIAMSDYHLTQYAAINVPFQFNMQDRVPTSAFDYEALPEGGKKRRSSRRYCLQGKYYRSKKKLYDALHEIECNI